MTNETRVYTVAARSVERHHVMVPQLCFDLAKAKVDFNFSYLDGGYQFVYPVHLQRTFLQIADDIFGEDLHHADPRVEEPLDNGEW